MATLCPVYVPRAEERAYAAVEGWSETPEARRALALVDYLETVSDALAAAPEAREVRARIQDEIISLTEGRLTDLREAALDEAVNAWPGDEDAADARDHLEGFACSTEKALRRARRDRLGDGLFA